MMCTLCINYYLKNPALPKFILLLIVTPVENAENAVDELTWLYINTACQCFNARQGHRPSLYNKLYIDPK